MVVPALPPKVTLLRYLALIVPSPWVVGATVTAPMVRGWSPKRFDSTSRALLPPSDMRTTSR